MNVTDIRRLSEARAVLVVALRARRRRTDITCSSRRSARRRCRPGTLQNVGWNGTELVAFRLHLPSRILWHNARDLETNQPTQTARGNILAWEQHLTDRLEGAPLDIRVEMDSQSILHRTLWLFAGAFAAAVAVLALLIWFTMRKGRARPQAAGRSFTALTIRSQAPGSRLARSATRSLLSASVFSAFVTDSSPSPVASDRASIRSTLLFTTPQASRARRRR